MDRPAESGADATAPAQAARRPRSEALRDGIVAEQAIREAMQRGDFDNLPGRGKPLPLQGWPSTPDAIAAGILKEANFVPEWIELARRIEDDSLRARRRVEEGRDAFLSVRAEAEDQLGRWRAAAASTAAKRPFWRRLGRHREDPRRLEMALRRFLAEAEQRRTRAFAACLRQVYELNRQIRRFNVVVPISDRQRLPIVVDQVAGEFTQAWPALRLECTGSALDLRMVAVEPPRPAPPEPPAEERLRSIRDPARLAGLCALRRGGRLPPIG